MRGTTSRPPAGKLGELVRLYRLTKSKTMRDVAEEIGISAPSVMRLEQGRELDAGTFVKVLSWLVSRTS